MEKILVNRKYYLKLCFYLNYAVQFQSCPQSAMQHGTLVAPDWLPTDSRASRTLSPSTTFPKTVCFSSSQLHVMKVRKEELGSVGVGSSVGHWEISSSSVLGDEVLVWELHSVDWITSSSVSGSEVSTLSNELGNDSMELGFLKWSGFPDLQTLFFPMQWALKFSAVFGHLSE